MISSTSVQMACTCGVLKPVQITKNSVKVPMPERSKTVMAEAFLFCAASTARRTALGRVSSFTCRSFTWTGSPVEALLKNVFLNARGNKPMNGLAAMSALASFRGGNVAGNGLEEIDGGFAQMGNELRGRDWFAFVFGPRTGKQI